MPATRRRRIVKRAVMALAAVVLLPASYVFSYVFMWWAIEAQHVTARQTYELRSTVFRPLMWYEDHQDWPLASEVASLRRYCAHKGRIAANSKQSKGSQE